ncbi:MAG: hypothetical protein Q8K26_02250 [Candidatus Gracilibacteria bacterium]|nr:hypothetical protein [Candidatus Gracilibacteria bacterium]
MSTHHDHWEEIFTKLDVLKHINTSGYFDLTAKDIKRLTGQEARLMSKVDFEKSLPTIMRDNKLSILAINNGVYRIARTNPFISVPKIKNKEVLIRMPAGYITLDPFDINSESGALDIAHVSGILKQVFAEDIELTIRGRLRKGANFVFSLDNVSYPINGVQIEVDGGYEGITSVNLIEAKIGSLNTISIRQLLYPELAWKRTLTERKKIRSFLFIYEEPFFRFIPFVVDRGSYTLDIDKEKVFKFIGGQDYDIMKIPVSDSPDMDFSAPFPQADSFDKILIMLRKIEAFGGIIKKDDLGEEMIDYNLSPRQIDYYSNCLKLFKFIKIDFGMVSITSKGRDILKLKTKEQAFELAKILFSEEIFYTSLHKGIDFVDDKLFSKYGKRKEDISLITNARRKQTLRKWIAWFNVMFDKNNVN